MESFATPLAQNVYVVAVANIGALIAFALILYNLVLRAIRFTRSAYQNTLKIALAKVARQRLVERVIAATDIHLFMAKNAIYAAHIVLGSILITMSLIGLSGARLPKVSGSSLPTFIDRVFPFVSAATALFGLAIVAWNIERLGRLCFDVATLRRRRHDRTRAARINSSSSSNSDHS